MARSCGVIALMLLSLAATGCGGYDECDAATLSGCDPGQVCRLVGAARAYCLTPCSDLTACEDDERCYRYPDRVSACTPQCATSPADCGAGWTCSQVGGSALEAICRPACDLESGSCPAGAVCVGAPAGGAFCDAPCDPLDLDGCGSGRVCELRTDGLRACYLPVSTSGRVLDLANGTGVQNAQVIATDETGAPATAVSESAAGGGYALTVPTRRTPTGALAAGTFTLRVFAAGYEPFPSAVRPAIPLDVTSAQQYPDGWRLSNALTDVGLLRLPQASQGLGRISGRVASSPGALPGGVLIVAEGSSLGAPLAFSDLNGAFTIFNVPAGTWVLRGYKAGLQLDAASLSLSAGQHLQGVTLSSWVERPLGTVHGSVQIVNAPGGSQTSVVLVPAATFLPTVARGEVPPGLRCPPPPAPPNVSGAFTISGVPDGRYAVLAAFENDNLVRDPDPGIAGTQIVFIEIPDGDSYEVSLPASFKVTEALAVLGPGAAGPDALSDATPDLVFADDAGEAGYEVVVYDGFGATVWATSVAASSGTTWVTVPYAGPTLQPGMFYQFRATSMDNHGDPIATTEDLRGVFYLIAP